MRPATSVATELAAARRRRWLVGLAAGLTGMCLAVKAIADQTLGAHPVDLGPMDLRLAFNPGVAFSFGDRLPSAVIVALTGAITLGVLVFAWSNARTLTSLSVVGFAAVLAGALSNLLDRATDGVVTDYFHTGWYPTFNLPDVLITIGVGLILISALRHGNDGNAEEARQSAAC
ncbi:signal peptidase II [Nocardioides sp.]|uniref:Putative signal peptidase n=1 Tax=metagenome TaxID=256318 RepID=A0A2P2BX32_9ZZZZ